MQNYANFYLSSLINAIALFAKTIELSGLSSAAIVYLLMAASYLPSLKRKFPLKS